MRKILLFSISLFSIVAMAQDVIIMKSGDEINAKVIKISADNIEYKKWSNLEGPVYTLSKYDVFMVKYMNGDKDVFNNSNDLSEDNEKTIANFNKNQPLKTKATPASDNSEIVAKYNQNIRANLKPSNKDAEYAVGIMGVTSSSILSTEDIEIKIVPATVYVWGDCEIRHYIEIHNKTDNIIYIDKGNSFRIYNNDETQCYYSTNQVNISSGNSSSVGVGLGAVANTIGIGGVAGTLANGISVGGSSYGVVTDSYIDQRILAIPPHAKANLSEHKQVKTKSQTLFRDSEYKSISEIECWNFDLPGQKGIVKKGERIQYSEDNTLYLNKYYITYSTSPTFENYLVLNFEIYLRELIGVRLGILGDGAFSWSDKLLKEYKKVFPDYWDDPYILTSTCGGILGGITKSK